MRPKTFGPFHSAGTQYRALQCCRGYPVLCKTTLRRLFELPRGLPGYYWIEASKEQWPDDSGLRVYVYYSPWSRSWKWGQRRSCGADLYAEASEQLGDWLNVPTGTTVEIYVRLIYEEDV